MRLDGREIASMERIIYVHSSKVDSEQLRALIMLAAVIRVFGGMSWADQYLSSVVVSGVCWSLAFATYAVRYWPVLTQPRIDGKPG